MIKITNYQLYCLLVMLVCPLAVLEQPHRLLPVAYNNAWLSFFPAIIPGILLILMYSQIIKKSRHAFPRLLEEHLGKATGKILGCAYILVFILNCSFTLRFFIEYMKVNVLPATPITIFIGAILLLGWAALKMGFSNIARSSEFVVILGLLFTFMIIFLSIFNNFHIERIQPIAYIDLKTYSLSVFLATFVLSKMMPVLSLAFFLPAKEKSHSIMITVLFTYVLILVLITLAIIVTRGIMPSLNFMFPTVNMIRLARIGNFIQNLDILFVAVWIMGIYGSVTILWFMACYTAQQIFNLRDYRFMAAPSTVIIGVLAIIISSNNLAVIIWSHKIIPYLHTFFFIFIPFIIFIVCLFKPVPRSPAPEPANCPDPLHKQTIPG